VGNHKLMDGLLCEVSNDQFRIDSVALAWTLMRMQPDKADAAHLIVEHGPLDLAAHQLGRNLHERGHSPSFAAGAYPPSFTSPPAFAYGRVQLTTPRHISSAVPSPHTT
jgi:hypothetical protein